MELSSDTHLAISVVAAIRTGDITALRTLILQTPYLPTAFITSRGSNGQVEGRTLLHIATDWPGHYPRVADTIHLLASAGADVSAPFQLYPVGGGDPAPVHTETPLHWAASSDDVSALEALLVEGADIDAPGSVLGGGPPIANAVWFKQWRAAEALILHGATVTLAQAAGMGLLGRVESMLLIIKASNSNAEDEVSRAFWYACRGGHLVVAKVLGGHDADINWTAPWTGHKRSLDVAREEGNDALVAWLEEEGAKSGLGLDDGRPSEHAADK